MRSRRAPLSAPFGVAVGVVLFSLAGPGEPARGQVSSTPSDREASLSRADELVEGLANAWFARDLEGYLALWDLSSAEQRRAETAAAREAFAADETRLSLLGRPRHEEGTARVAIDVQVFTATEPQARVDYWRFLLERRGGRWALVEREAGADVEGLIHLPLGPEAWRVRGVPLRVEDFELRMDDGTLFSTPESVGPTALVFVGRGRVLFTPRPAAEKEQLRQFGGSTALDRAVKWAFVRLHPDDLGRVLDTARLQPDPAAGRRRAEAVKRWSQRAARTFMVDADLPRSPWWLYPNRGDAVVDFPWKGKRVLTYAVAGGEPEDLNLFERDRGLKICAYPSAGRPARTRGRRPGVVDILHHDLIARFEPSRRTLNAVDTMRLRLHSPVSTIRLKLHDDFRVGSVSSGKGSDLLFLRVREQGSFVVSLGPHAGRIGEFSLTVRYSGRHDPVSVDHGPLQPFPESSPLYRDSSLLNPPPLVYSNRTAWYPRWGEDDYATLRAHLDTPEDVLAVTGGELISTRTSEGRTRATYKLTQPGKYFSVVVGRLESLGMRQRGDQVVRGFGGPGTSGESRQNMVTAEEILSFYAERFGPCPYPVVNQVLAEAFTPGGHSPPGLVYLQRRPLSLVGQRLREDPANVSDQPDFFLAHELAHQWWGQGVGPASYRDQWLSEAWAQYSAALWVRQREDEGAFRDILGRMAGWARRYNESGPVHLGQRLGHLKRDQRIRRAVVYDKGALVLHMLRRMMGDEAFFGGARGFLEEHRYGRATTEDLRAALEEASGRDLEPYFEQWIYGTGLTRLRWSARTEEARDGFETTVQVRPEKLPGVLPLELILRTSEEDRVQRVDLPPEGGSWTIVTPHPVRKVEVNDDRGLLLAEAKKVRRLPPPQR